MAVPQANWIAGEYTIAAGANQLPSAAANAYYTAWVTDRPGGAGWMSSDGTQWLTNDTFVEPATATPQAPGVAAVGSSVKYAREDHRHSSQAVPAAGSATPLAPTAGGSVGVATAFSREDHQHPPQTIAGFVVGSLNARTISAGTAYQATNTAKPATIYITITSTANFSLVGGTTNSAVVVSGTSSGIGTSGGTSVGSYSNSVTGTIAVGLNMNSAMTSTYTFNIAAGEWFAVRSTSGSVTISAAFDQALG